MKQLLILYGLVITLSVCFADTTFFSQNFNDPWLTTSPPVGWSIFYQPPLGFEDWHRDSANSWSANNSGYAKISLTSKSLNPTDTIIDSLVSPVINSWRYRNIVLRCTSYIRHLANNISAKIIGSTDGGATYPYLIAEFNGHYHDSILPPIVLNIPWADEQSNLRIAFVFIGRILDIDFWCLDDISLTGQYVFDTDIAPIVIMKPLNVQPPSLCSVQVKIVNLGKSSIMHIPVCCSLYNWAGSPIAYACIEVEEMHHNDTINVYLDDPYYFPNLPGFYRAKAWTEVSGDENVVNDTIEKDFAVIWAELLGFSQDEVFGDTCFPVREQGWGVKITPNYYPALINQVRCYLGFESGTQPYRYKIRIVDDNGPAGAPGSTIFETPNNIDSILEWKTTYLLNEELYIDSGSVYVFYIQVDDAPYAPSLFYDIERNSAASYYKYCNNNYLVDYPPGDWLIKLGLEYRTRNIYDHDLRVVYITEPVDEFVRRPYNFQTPVKIRIENIGNYAQNNFAVYCTVRSFIGGFPGSIRRDFSAVNLGLGAGRDTIIEFYPWNVLYNEPVQVTARIGLPTDQRPANNYKTAVITNKLGIFSQREGLTEYAWFDCDSIGGPIYNWYYPDSARLVLENCDDSITPCPPMSFNFPYYDSTYNQCYVSSNGFLTFSQSQPSISTNTAIPVSDAPNAVLYIFWDDLVLPYGSGAKIMFQEYGSRPNRFCVITWHNVMRKNADSAYRLNFQIVLYENGNFIYQYKNVFCNWLWADYGKSATVGIENTDGTGGLQYLLGTDSLISNWPENKLSNNRTIKWYRQIRDVGVSSFVTPRDTVLPRPTTPFVRIKNYGTEMEDTVLAYLSITNTPYDTFLMVFNLMPSEERLVQFPDWDAYVGNYTLHCSTSLYVDQQPANNYQNKPVCVTVWMLLPEIPVYADNRKVKYGAMTYASDFHKIFALKGATNEFWCYNINANRWESLPRMPLAPSGKKPKAGCALTFGQGRKIYAIKGGKTDDFYVYDILDSNWTSLAPIRDTIQKTKLPKDGAGIAYSDYDGLIYAIVGNNSQDLLCYVPGQSPQGNYWRYIDRLPWLYYGTKGFKHGASIHNVDSMLYIFQGNKSRDLCRYDIPNVSWIEQRCTIPGVKNVVKAGGTATYYSENRTIYFFLGGNKQALWKYNIADNSFDSISSIPRGPKKKKIKTGAAIIAAGVNDPLFILKGGNIAEFWAYALWSAGEKSTRPDDNNIRAYMVSEKTNLPAPIISISSKSQLTINYTISHSCNVLLKLYSLNGQFIETIIDQVHNAGTYSVVFNNKNKIPQGIYFVKGNIGNSTLLQKIVLI